MFLLVLALDSSGESLHRRGYRQEAVEAPLNEVLAAGMILMTGWRGECDLNGNSEVLFVFIESDLFFVIIHFVAKIRVRGIHHIQPVFPIVLFHASSFYFFPKVSNLWKRAKFALVFIVLFNLY